jgi:hypothetical protein
LVINHRVLLRLVHHLFLRFTLAHLILFGLHVFEFTLEFFLHALELLLYLLLHCKQFIFVCLIFEARLLHRMSGDYCAPGGELEK